MRLDQFLMADHLVRTGKLKIKGFPDIRKNGKPYNFESAKCSRCRKFLLNNCSRKNDIPTNNNPCKDFED